jgi:hypothetical protein
LLALPSPPKLENHPLSAVRGCLFNTFVATLHICRPSPPSATWGRATPWWQGTQLTWRPVTCFCEHGNEPSSSIKKAGYCFTTWVTIGLAKNIPHHGERYFTTLYQLHDHAMRNNPLTWRTSCNKTTHDSRLMSSNWCVTQPINWPTIKVYRDRCQAVYLSVGTRLHNSINLSTDLRKFSSPPPDETTPAYQVSRGGAPSLRVNRPGCEINHSTPSNAEVKNAWSYTSIPQNIYMARCLIKQEVLPHDEVLS